MLNGKGSGYLRSFPITVHGPVSAPAPFSLCILFCSRPLLPVRPVLLSLPSPYGRRAGDEGYRAKY